MSLALLVAATLVMTPAHGGAWAAERPNILLIMVDDFGYECVGANGSTSYQTPHLDDLARGGMRFEHCHVQPLCTPTRVQLMTGLSNHRNYIHFGILDPHATTFAHLFREAGYATCVAGKWQLQGGYEGPGRFGFDEYCLWQLNRRPSRYANPGLEINGQQIDYTKGEYGPDLVNAYLCDFITRHKDRPFFAYYPMMLTHGPFDPTPDSADYDPAAKGEGRRQGQASDKARHFAEMVAYADKLIGKAVATLDANGLREKTLVVIVGDNGTGRGIQSRMGDRVVDGGKGKTADTGTHVPLIVNRPGAVPAGRVCPDLVDSTDFLPTLVEHAGLKLPDGHLCDGQSFAPQLRGESGTPRPWIYCWYERDGKRDNPSEHVRDQHYKLYRGGRFYDVVNDPDEKRALDIAALSPEARRTHDEFRRALDSIQPLAAAVPGPRP
jgi:arylsulfatase A